MDYPSLYEKTGDIKDINTLLVPRADMQSPPQQVRFNPAENSPATALQMACVIALRDNDGQAS